VVKNKTEKTVKMEEAQKLGIPIVSVEEFMANYHV
jgi:ribosomal protein S2